MEVELLYIKGRYEIWADNKFVAPIAFHKNETREQYKARAEKDYDEYISRLKAMRSGAVQKESIKKTTL